MTFSVAIIGRPNVGKSTLFNRLVGRQLALVDDRPGVTRDRREGQGKLGGLRFNVLDTAGLEDADDASLAGRMRKQSERAIEDADVSLFMIDSRIGLTAMDQHFAEILRRFGKPVIVLANKSEGRNGEAGALEAYALGLGDPIALSAAHGHGLDELHDMLEPLMAVQQADVSTLEDDDEWFDDGEDDVAPDRPLRLAIVGRPNAGKSTLINSLIGEDRMLTGPEAGITRDAIAIDWQWKERKIKLWDTAGMRRKARVQEKLEKLSVADGLRAVKFAEVVVLMLDATQALERQDLSIADLVAREGRALVLAINKWDLVDDPQAALKELKLEAKRLLPQLDGVPLVTMSALNGRGIKKLMPAVMKVYEIWNARCTTAELNRWLSEQTQRHPPPAPGGRRIRIKFMTQARSRPPTFAIFGNKLEDLPEAYKRYLINGLREDFGLTGIPIRIHTRRGKNPFDK